MGGRIELSGNISDNRDASGSGLIQVELRKTYTDCAYTAGGVIIIVRGDPYLTHRNHRPHRRTFGRLTDRTEVVTRAASLAKV
jgi:hypothetical protein